MMTAVILVFIVINLAMHFAHIGNIQRLTNEAKIHSDIIDKAVLVFKNQVEINAALVEHCNANAECKK